MTNAKIKCKSLTKQIRRIKEKKDWSHYIHVTHDTQTKVIKDYNSVSNRQ